MFRAMARQVYGTAEDHDRVRQELCDYMYRCAPRERARGPGDTITPSPPLPPSERSHFGAYITGDFDVYVADKRGDGSWGDDLELLAAEELYDRPVEVYSAEAGSAEPLNIMHAAGTDSAHIQVRVCAREGMRLPWCTSVSSVTLPPPSARAAPAAGLPRPQPLQHAHRPVLAAAFGPRRERHLAPLAAAQPWPYAAQQLRCRAVAGHVAERGGCAVDQRTRREPGRGVGRGAPCSTTSHPTCPRIPCRSGNTSQHFY